MEIGKTVLVVRPYNVVTDQKEDGVKWLSAMDYYIGKKAVVIADCVLSDSERGKRFLISVDDSKYVWKSEWLREI